MPANRHDRLAAIDPAGVAARLNADGYGIVWAIVASGIDGTHPHFLRYQNLELPHALKHRDFTLVAQQDAEPSPGEKPPDADALAAEALFDPMGYGTHIAGIVSGVSNVEDTSIAWDLETSLTGVAPRCKVMSLKVLDDEGRGNARTVLAALQYVESLNKAAGTIVVHGVTVALSLPWDPRNYPCGGSPICEAAHALIEAGVVVVAPAGNAGEKGLSTIDDPGNAEHVITVGSTHRKFTQRWGPSYFSSRGPTADGRLKPDLLAPGERIMSAVAPTEVDRPKPAKKRSKRREPVRPTAAYRENDGTGIATGFVAGAVAALLSVRTDLIGRPHEVKRLLLDSATDLGRDRYFQGRGVLNLSRALDSAATVEPEKSRVQSVADITAPNAPVQIQPVTIGAPPPPTTDTGDGKRFSVAFSFAGEHASYVERVVRALRSQGGIPRRRIFYHRQFEAELSRIDLDTYLQEIYGEQAELMVVFISAEYVKKEWTGLEWRVVREIIKQKRARQVMPIRFDETHIAGLFSTDGYLSAAGRDPEDVADLILDRLEVNRAAAR